MSTVKFLSAAAAAALDRELMSTQGFSLDQLMELAGLSVAQAIYKSYPPSVAKDVLILVGPGNNGGDGLVAARHLKLFGYTPSVFYPKKSKGPLFTNLQTQLTQFDIPFIETFEEVEARLSSLEGLAKPGLQIVDALFGFSFRPPVREPFDKTIKLLNRITTSTDFHVPITSVDIPSGWNVDSGPEELNPSETFQPDVLVSLTAPKPAASFFTGKHFLGGRFVTDKLAAKWGFDVPKYPGVDQVTEVPVASRELNL